MSDCSKCTLRLESAGGQIKPFCANEECVKYDKRSMQKAKDLIGKPVKKICYLENGLSKYNDGDECFILCANIDCFAIHSLKPIAEKVSMCEHLKNGVIKFREACWD